MDTPALSRPEVRVRQGLATLGPDLVRLRQALESKFLSWAAECGADPMLFPPLMRVADLARFDYFLNFPQLPLLVTRVHQDCLHDIAHGGGDLQTIPAANLATAEYALPSAACYNIYLHLSGTVLEGARYVTTVANCFRNETAYDELRRLWGFTMREIVCIGRREEVEAHLVSFKQRVLAFGDRLGLGLVPQAGTDPFYEPQSSRAVMQQLFPQKEEFVYQGSVAIGSVNFHRNFFGERCDIRTSDGQHAFTGCVAFGIERWLHALTARFQQNVDAAVEAVAGA
jgi:seryl-tRNA synthetase